MTKNNGRMIESQSGQAMIEYTLIIAIVAAIAIFTTADNSSVWKLRSMLQLVIGKAESAVRNAGRQS